MRIAFVAPFGLRAKGTTRARALPLARALAARRHVMALFIPPYDSPADSGKRWEEEGVDVINLPLPGFGGGHRALAHMHLALRLLRAVRRWDPDLIHVFKPKGPSGLVGAAAWLGGLRKNLAKSGAAAHGHRPPVVMDSDDWEGPGGWNDDPRAAYSSLERRFFAWQERYGLSHADAWTVTSDCLRERAVRFGADPARVFVLPNGIAVGNTSPSAADDLHEPPGSSPQPAISDQPSAVLYTRFAGVRVEEVAAIWNEVRTVVPEARLAVLGHGLAGEEEVLRGVAGVELRGWVEHRELLATLAAAQVAVVPWADTPSNRARHSAKVLELMQAGLPIVAYAVGELPATLGDGGVLVEPGDQAAFAKAIMALLLDKALARQIGAEAQRRVLDRFVWQQLAEIALEAYRAAGACPEESGSA